MIRSLSFVVLYLFACVATARGDSPFPAHRVAGNTYYVGSTELASYLITTPAGHILINSSFEETVPLIRGAIESLGFKMSDVKYLLASHAHSDHVAGHAKMRELTGAKVLVMVGDDKVVAAGGAGQYLYADSRWPACPVDRVLKDGDEVKLGGVTLIARHTPGHTRGCTTWTWKESVDDKELRVVVIGSPNVNPGYRLVGNTDYPTITDDFKQTFSLLKSLPCDVFLGAHGNYYDMLAKHERLEKKLPGNPFVDPQGYKAYVTLKEVTFAKKLADQQAAPLDEGAAAEQLRKAGAEVTLTKGHVTGVAVKDLSTFTIADFEALSGLVHLKTLSTSGEALNDNTLSYLTGLAALEDLSTNAAQFSDDALWQLTLLGNLKQIKFFHTSLKRKDFTGRGFASFASLKNLRRLTVAGCPFNDEGMAAVGKLTQLENFRTWHTYQTEAGNESLKSLTNLKSLHLGQRLRRYGGASNAHSLTDSTLDVVSQLKSLDTLTLGEQKFSIEALAKLKALPNLKRLELSQVDLPAQEIERAQTLLPGIQINWKPVTAEERAKLDRLLAP
ncbi:Metallo-beta-lactamase L1 precursor [Anatilimnocola aggregata]|uniref:Metallo-beta-lactamase L1 n=1 Tax=Anatilimnocola aggregata TaxID=2528021 RepID=A0A517YDI2_9BACT|nr:subclass B3 metallo-beta-lactamase [Anatilimnocola aggregata]QDU28290.1 Metallo-beta-lactamase L1 precursor [Anatilimnocola aggregata]